MTAPVRLRLSRAKGFNLQALSLATNGLPAVSVARGPGRVFGNPWRVGDTHIPDAAEARRRFRAAVIGFESNGSWCKPNAHPGSYIGKIIHDAPTELRGKNLACWCKVISPSGYCPCHADVLLSIANDIPMERVIRENTRRAKGETL